MKEALIIFFIALALGSVINSIVQLEQSGAQSTAAAAEEDNAFVSKATDQDFDEKVLKADQPVLVDFWAPWCGPCRMLGPVVARIAQKYAGQLKVVKVNYDDSPEAARRYNVSAIPHLFVFRNGKPVEDIEGAAPQATIEAMIEKSFAQSSPQL